MKQGLPAHNWIKKEMLKQKLGTWQARNGHIAIKQNSCAMICFSLPIAKHKIQIYWYTNKSYNEIYRSLEHWASQPTSSQESSPQVQHQSPTVSTQVLALPLRKNTEEK